MSLGPVMLDLQGIRIDSEERELLRHPLVGGVILFTRNFESTAQLQELVKEIHALRHPRLLIAVDHEGGRVQRFRNGFTRLPAARIFGQIYEKDRRRARYLAESAGWIMASELRTFGIDFSFAPVLDLDLGVSKVIGDRAFHSQAEAVAELAGAYVMGMRHAGMAAVGKHFPGHGGVEADSHVDVPVDDRPFQTIVEQDLVPFERLFANGLAGVMPAHVSYPRVDPHPAGFSPFWLKEVLRRRLGFQGVIFSDDLSMEGASVAGGPVARAEAALAAGCDMALVCNNRAAAVSIVEGLHHDQDPVLHARLARMHWRHPVTIADLHGNPQWLQALESVNRLVQDPSLELDLA